MSPIDVHFEIVQVEDGQWRVELRSPDGITRKRVRAIDDALLKSQKVGVGDWRALLDGLHRGVLGTREQRGLGELIRNRLFDAVKFEMTLEALADTPLRLLFDIDGSSAPTLACLPVEMAFSERFFLIDEGLRAIHVVTNAAAAELLLPVKTRLAIVTAHTDGKLPTKAELAQHAVDLREVAEGMGWLVEIYADCNAANLESVVGSGPDLLYVACHGQDDPSSAGRLMLRGGSLAGDRLAEWLEAARRKGAPVHAAIFCACSSAAPADEAHTHALAEWMAGDRRMVGAIGFRGPVRMEWAFRFTHQIFAHLAEGDPLDAAFCRARRTMDREDPQWLLPVLYARPAPRQRPRTREASIDPIPRGTRNPSHLPPPPRPYFSGREAVLARVRAVLEPGHTTIIAGEGGVGKSELASVVGHEWHQHGQRVVWLAHADVDVRGALSALARLTDPGFRADPHKSDAEVAELVRALVAHQPGLLILDDVSDPLTLDLFEQGPGWSTLVTTRVETLSLHGELIPLGRLERAEATALISRLLFGLDAPPTGEDEAVSALVDEIGCLPLALELAACTIRDRGDGIVAYLGDLETRRSNEAKLETVLLRGIERLSESDLEIWLLFGIFPGSGVPPRMLADALNIPLPVLMPRLNRLTRLHFARHDAESGLFGLHQEMHRAARRRALGAGDAAADARLDAAARGLDEAMRWVHEALGKNSDEALLRWGAVRSTLAGVDPEVWAGSPNSWSRIARALANSENFLKYDWDPASRQPRLEAALYYARRARSLQLECAILCDLGALKVQRGEFTGAEADYVEAIGKFDAVTPSHGRASALFGLGEIEYLRDDLPRAEAVLDKALQAYSDAGDTLGQANVLSLRGDVRVAQAQASDGHLAQQRIDDAKRDYARALQLYDATGDNLGPANIYFARGKLKYTHQ